MDAREQRGLVIAAKCRIKQVEGGWIVPSQSTPGGKYKVYPSDDGYHCTCPDHEIIGCVCKHIHAVKITIEREENEDGSVTETVTMTETIKRKTYPQNWRAYNAAQTTEKATFQTLLRDLCKGIKEPPSGRGRPTIPLADAIFAAVFKVYSTVSCRRFMSRLTRRQRQGIYPQTAVLQLHFQCVRVRSDVRDSQVAVLATAEPLKAIETTFACDSSGFSGSRFDRWYDHKWGEHQDSTGLGQGARYDGRENERDYSRRDSGPVHATTARS